MVYICTSVFTIYALRTSNCFDTFYSFNLEKTNLCRLFWTYFDTEYWSQFLQDLVLLVQADIKLSDASLRILSKTFLVSSWSSFLNPVFKCSRQSIVVMLHFVIWNLLLHNSFIDCTAILDAVLLRWLSKSSPSASNKRSLRDKFHPLPINDIELDISET